jgi:hypothetical protein
MKVFEFSPGNSAWNSQGHLNSSAPFPAVEELTVCYRLKIYRFLPSIYWINVLEYAIPGEEEESFCCEIRSRECKKRTLSGICLL